jgi:hypothetical protein
MTTALFWVITQRAVHNRPFLKYRVSLTGVKLGARGGAVGSGTALPAGRSRVRYPMVSLEFFIDINIPVALFLFVPLN